jgi:hypothetical protein
MLGYETVHDVMGMDSLLQVFAPSEHDRLLHACARLQREQTRSLRHECQAYRRDGTVMLVEITSALVQWDGRPAIQDAMVSATGRGQNEVGSQPWNEGVDQGSWAMTPPWLSQSDATVLPDTSAGSPVIDLSEPARLEALQHTGLLDRAPEQSFDHLTELACRLLQVPVAWSRWWMNIGSFSSVPRGCSNHGPLVVRPPCRIPSANTWCIHKRRW